jgi:hypothetical protein
MPDTGKFIISGASPATDSSSVLPISVNISYI